MIFGALPQLSVEFFSFVLNKTQSRRNEGTMRSDLTSVCIAFLAAYFAIAQPPATTKPAEPAPAKSGVPSGASSDSELKTTFESKVKAEWDALKKKDAKAYGELLADDYEGVEVDGQGERTKTQALNEIPAGNVFDYTLWGFKIIPLSPDAACVIYEVTMQFPPKSVLRYSRVYITEIWVKRKGDWKELHYQETHVK